MAKGRKTGQPISDTAHVVADLHRVSVRYVQMVRVGDRENEDILATCIDYEVGKSNLIKALEKQIPLTPNPEKYARKKD